MAGQDLRRHGLQRFTLAPVSGQVQVRWTSVREVVVDRERSAA